MVRGMGRGFGKGCARAARRAQESIDTSLRPGADLCVAGAGSVDQAECRWLRTGRTGRKAFAGSGEPEGQVGQGDADDTEEKGGAVGAGHVVDVAAEPGAEDRADPHAGEHQAGNGAEMAAGEDVRRPGVDGGGEEPAPQAEADGVGVQEPGL